MMSAMPRRPSRSESASARRAGAREARAALYRQMIFEAAERAFAEKGVDDTKMEEIAAEAGLALGTVYSVVKGKARLVAEIHETRMREAMAGVDGLTRSSRDPVQSLMTGIEGYVRFFAAHPDYLRMHLRAGYAWGLSSSQPSPAHEEALRRASAAQESLFERGIAAGVFHAGKPRLLTRVLIAMQQVQLADWVEEGMERDPSELVGEMQEQARRAFCTAEPRP
jgi:AcrR family transcriptional regulator